MNKRIMKNMLIFGLVAMMLFTFTACGSKIDGTANEQVKEEKNVEKEITALLPPWYEFPQSMLDDFENETGIKVNLEIMDWDPMTDKIFTAIAAGQSPADVTEFSWDWVGKFGKAGWYTPLNDKLGESFFEDITTKDIYKYEDNYLAVPIYNDFRVSYVNRKDYESAGVEIPTTPDELLNTARIIKESGVEEYPISIPLSSTAGTTTPWFLLTKTYGGELFDENFEPTFTDPQSPSYKAMEWIATAIREELINPAAISMQGTDIVDRFKKGEGSFDLAGWAGNVTMYKDGEQSEIANEVEVVKVPFVGNTRSYGLHEAIGIPSASENKEYAIEFIKYLNRPEILERLFDDMGIFPNHQTTIDKAIEDGKLPKVFGEVMPTIEPLFKQGAPNWYAEFESEAASTINEIAKGNVSVKDGLESLAEYSRNLQKNEN